MPHFFELLTVHTKKALGISRFIPESFNVYPMLEMKKLEASYCSTIWFFWKAAYKESKYF